LERRNEEPGEQQKRDPGAAAATLARRTLTREEARVLHEELKTTPNILGYTVPELLRFREVIVAHDAHGVFAGVCLSKDLTFGWTDIAVLYVLPAFRGRKIGTLLYAAAFDEAKRRERHVFTLSRSPEVIGLMGRFGMDRVRSLWRAPLAVHLHMNCHMTSAYRIRESIRKAALLKNSHPLVAGTKKRGTTP
jgi:GNAT superfamily N-acetyltransferase